MDPINLKEALDEIKRLSGEMNKSTLEGRKFGLEEAEKEKVYRLAKAEKMAEARLSGELKTVAEMQIWVDGQVADKRMQRDIARVMADSLDQETRNYRQQQSSIQTLLNVDKARNVLLNSEQF